MLCAALDPQWPARPLYEDLVKRVFNLKRDLSQLKRIVTPLREMLNRFSRDLALRWIIVFAGQHVGWSETGVALF